MVIVYMQSYYCVEAFILACRLSEPHANGSTGAACWALAFHTMGNEVCASRQIGAAYVLCRRRFSMMVAAEKKVAIVDATPQLSHLLPAIAPLQAGAMV
jgi:hypothetical protein